MTIGNWIYNCAFWNNCFSWTLTNTPSIGRKQVRAIHVSDAMTLFEIIEQIDAYMKSLPSEIARSISKCMNELQTHVDRTIQKSGYAEVCISDLFAQFYFKMWPAGCCWESCSFIFLAQINATSYLSSFHCQMIFSFTYEIKINVETFIWTQIRSERRGERLNSLCCHCSLHRCPDWLRLLISQFNDALLLSSFDIA